MTEKTSQDNISKIRTELYSGKTKRQIANELNLSYYVVKKYGKEFVTSKRIPVKLEQKIRQEVSSGKSKRRVAEELNLAYDTVYKYTADLGLTHYQKYGDLEPETIEKIREEVSRGKTRVQTARSVGLPYSKVERFTRDIPMNCEITKEQMEQIRRDAAQGKPKSIISLEMGIPYLTVMRYTRGITLKQTQPLPQEMIHRIRNMVKNGRPKLHVAKELQVSFWTVRKYTEDITTRRYIHHSPELIEKIRKSVESGNSKTQTAIDLGVSFNIVCRYTRDLPGKINSWPRISGCALQLLEELVKNGYALHSSSYGFKEFLILKEHFPSIFRVKQYNKVVYFLDDKSKIAAKAFLEDINKRIISYKKLNQIVRPFGIELDKGDKDKFITKSKNSKSHWNLVKIQIK